MPNHASSGVGPQNSTTIIEEVPVSMSPFVRANPSLSFTENRSDILLNPYAPPVNDERYLIPIRMSAEWFNYHSHSGPMRLIVKLVFLPLRIAKNKF